MATPCHTPSTEKKHDWEIKTNQFCFVRFFFFLCSLQFFSFSANQPEANLL